MFNAAVSRTGGVSKVGGGSKEGMQSLVSAPPPHAQGWHGVGCAEAKSGHTALVCNLQTTYFLSYSFE